MNQTPVITDFTAGELSDKLSGRFDLAVYAKGASKMENFMPFSQGGVTYRPGTTYLGVAKDEKAVRLVPFIIAQDVAFVLEFGLGYLRFWKDGALVQDDTLDAPFEIVTPYVTEGMLRELQVAQIGTSLYLVHRGASPRRLVWVSGVTFSVDPDEETGDLVLPEIPFYVLDSKQAELPFQDAGDWPGAVAAYAGRIFFAGSDNEPGKIWASKPFDHECFIYCDVITTVTEQIQAPDPFSGSFVGTTAFGTSRISGIGAEDIAHLSVGDALSGPGLVNKDLVAFPAETKRLLGDDPIYPALFGVSQSIVSQLAVGETLTGGSLASGGATISGFDGTLIYVTPTPTATTAVNVIERAELRSRITEVGDDYVVLDLAPTASGTDQVFSIVGFDPATATTKTTSTTREVTGAGHAFTLSLASDQNDRILWMAAGRELVVGTISGEWVLPEDITATNLRARLQTRYGSAAIQGRLVGDSVLFVQSSGTRLREYFYQNESGAYQSPDLTFLADHVLGDGVVDLDYTNIPEPAVLATLVDGTLAVLLYNKTHGAVAWCRLLFEGGAVESVATVPDSSGQDQVWLSIRRGAARCIERMDPLFGGKHLDSAVEVQARAAGSQYLYGLHRFDGLTVVIDAPAGTFTAAVAGDYLTWPAGVSEGQTCRIGLAIHARLRTMRLSTQTKEGTGQTKLKRINAVTFRLLASHPFKVGYADRTGSLEDAVILPEDAPFTGDLRVPFRGAWDRDGWVTVEHESIKPLTILSIVPEVDA